MTILKKLAALFIFAVILRIVYDEAAPTLRSEFAPEAMTACGVERVSHRTSARDGEGQHTHVSLVITLSSGSVMSIPEWSECPSVGTMVEKRRGDFTVRIGGVRTPDDMGASRFIVIAVGMAALVYGLPRPRNVRRLVAAVHAAKLLRDGVRGRVLSVDDGSFLFEPRDGSAPIDVVINDDAIVCLRSRLSLLPGNVLVLALAPSSDAESRDVGPYRTSSAPPPPPRRALAASDAAYARSSHVIPFAIALAVRGRPYRRDAVPTPRVLK